MPFINQMYPLQTLRAYVKKKLYSMSLLPVDILSEIAYV